jgi:hypothetical protein
MNDLAMKRDQHAAAMTYLDTGTLALADVLAMLDDEPDEPSPNDTRHHRRTPRHRRALPWVFGGVRVVAMTGAVMLGAAILAPGAVQTAAAATPFDDPTYKAVHAASGWKCVQEDDARARQCVSADGRIHAEVTAAEGPEGSKTFSATYALDGKVVRTEATVYRSPAAVVSLRQAMRANPFAFPNFHEGPGWVLWSTDTAAADWVASLMPTHADNPPARP